MSRLGKENLENLSVIYYSVVSFVFVDILQFARHATRRTRENLMQAKGLSKE